MEGLEISVLLLSKVKENNNNFRIDDSFFSKKYVQMLTILKNKSSKKLIDLSLVITDFGAFSQMNFVSYKESGIPFLRNQNVQANIINHTDCVFIDEKTYNKLSLKLAENDIVIPRVGTLGNAAVISKEMLPITANQNIAQIKPNLNLVNPYYIATFLSCEYGNMQILRSSTGNVQQWLNLENINNINIPLLHIKFQSNIKNLILNGLHLLVKSDGYYQQAEDILLEELELKGFIPTQQAVNIKSLKESFEITGRLDAEYYQLKYEGMINHIKSNHYKSLETLVNIKKSIEPGSDAYAEKGVPFVRVADYSKMGVVEPTIKLKQSYYQENKKQLDKLMLKKDTILLSKDGSIGIAYLITEDLNYITSGAILHLNIIDGTVLPEYLTLVLNSRIVQQQAERDAGGSIISHWRLTQIQETIIPIVNIDIQQKISTLIQQSFALKSQSEKLLDIAKQAVEMAIEIDEETAMQFIKENTNNIDLIN